MAVETRQGRKEPVPVLFAWGAPTPEGSSSLLDAAWLWVGGSVALLVWTGLALVLTSA